MSDLKINFPVKVPQGLNVMSNEARTKTIRDIESKVLDDMGLPKDTFSKTKASKSKVSQFLENVKGNKILTKRNALIAAGVAIVGISAGAIAKHIHNKKA